MMHTPDRHDRAGISPPSISKLTVKEEQFSAGACVNVGAAERTRLPERRFVQRESGRNSHAEGLKPERLSEMGNLLSSSSVLHDLTDRKDRRRNNDRKRKELVRGAGEPCDEARDYEQQNSAQNRKEDSTGVKSQFCLRLLEHCIDFRISLLIRKGGASEKTARAISRSGAISDNP